METILVVNAGSSSVKFQVFAVGGNSRLHRHLKGQIDGVGTRPRLRAFDERGDPLADRAYPIERVQDLPAALKLAGEWLREEIRIDPIAIGHRVVHGGPYYDGPVLIDHAVVSHLERFIPLAPLHQSHNLAPIRSLLHAFPGLPQVACFDTAFHRNHGALADHYAIPHQFHAEGIRRYGFHGLSYEYVIKTLPTIMPEVAGKRIIVAHLGSGSSMCAIKDGRSIESTMGFTALDGLPMGTRPGQLDPGVLLYLLSERGMSAASLQDFLYRDCGLKGLSGISNDMRELEASDDPYAVLATEYFAYRVGLNAGMLAAALQGLDTFIFTAGIGENSCHIRARVAERLEWLGVSLDPALNSSHSLRISRPDSRVGVYVVPTDEELMIAQHTLSTLRNAQLCTQKHREVS